MSKIIRDVFLIIGTLVIIMIAWQLVFANDNGVLKIAYNSLANNINKQWVRVNNQEATLLPEWTSTPPTYTDATNPTNYEVFRATSFY